MKNVHDFVEIKTIDDKDFPCHEIHIKSEKTNLLGDPHKHKLAKYFDEINEEEIANGKSSIYKDIKNKFKISIPKSRMELKSLLDDLSTILNS